MVFQFKKNGLELHIKRRSIEEWFTLIVFMLPFTYGLLFDLLNIPDNYPMHTPKIPKTFLRH